MNLLYKKLLHFGIAYRAGFPHWESVNRCVDVSSTCVQLLNMAGTPCQLRTGMFVEPKYTAYHAWVDAGALILDLTADQFDLDLGLVNGIYVGRKPRQYVQHPFRSPGVLLI